MKEYQKSQEVRLLDVFVIGPLLIYTGVMYKKDLPNWLGLSLLVIGSGTILYNARNYYLNKKNEQQ